MYRALPGTQGPSNVQGPARDSGTIWCTGPCQGLRDHLMYRDQPGNLQGILRDHLLFRDQPGTQGWSTVQGPARETTGNTQGSSTLPEPPREHKQGPPGKKCSHHPQQIYGTTREHIQGPSRDYLLYKDRKYLHGPHRDQQLLRDQQGNLSGPPREHLQGPPENNCGHYQGQIYWEHRRRPQMWYFVDLRFAAQCFFTICDLLTQFNCGIT
jgi:hypothetical protein